MDKKVIRPILVEALVKAKKLEEDLYLRTVNKPGELGWVTLGRLLESRQEARLRRAQAELQLWLADQQWERQEQAERADKAQNPPPLRSVSSRTSKG